MKTYNVQTALGCGWDSKVGAWVLYGPGFKVISTFFSKRDAFTAFYESEAAGNET